MKSEEKFPRSLDDDLLLAVAGVFVDELVSARRLIDRWGSPRGCSGGASQDGERFTFWRVTGDTTGEDQRKNEEQELHRSETLTHDPREALKNRLKVDDHKRLMIPLRA